MVSRVEKGVVSRGEKGVVSRLDYCVLHTGVHVCTVGPLNSRHVGTSYYVHYREVSSLRRLEMDINTMYRKVTFGS